MSGYDVYVYENECVADHAFRCFFWEGPDAGREDFRFPGIDLLSEGVAWTTEGTLRRYMPMSGVASVRR